MRTMSSRIWRIGFVICVASLAVCCSTSVRADKVFVTEDTYLDGRSTGQATNFGTNQGVRVFVNRTTPDPTHGLFALPP